MKRPEAVAGRAGPSMSLEDGLAYWAEIAIAHRVTGQTTIAELVTKLCDWVLSATEEHRRWLTESEAVLRSGRSGRWIRAQFAAWQSAGHAKREGKGRLYRMVVIPIRGPAHASFESGRRAAEERAA